MLFSELYQSSRELKKLILLFVTFPVKPTEFVVLTISIVITLLCPTPFISAAEYRHPLGKKQCGEKIAALPVAQIINLRIIARTFNAAIPRLIIVIAVAIFVVVQFVVLFVVADQVDQCKSIVDCNEVDARVRPSPVVLIEIGASGEPIGHVTNASFVAFPKAPDRVSVFPVPFRPRRGKVADLVAAFSHIPRLCDQLHLRKHRVLLNYLEKRMQCIEPRMTAR